MENGFLEQFPLPEMAMEHMRKQNYQPSRAVSTGQAGVEVMMAHDRGVAYSFHTHAEYNPVASRKLNYEKFDEQTLIEFFIDKDNRFPCRIHDLPEELLRFELTYTEVPTSDGKGVKDKVTFGECIGGLYKEAFDRFKAGLSAPGLPLSKWGVMSDGECATLAMAGIFSVEQLASLPRSKITSKYPQIFHEYHERAIQFVNGKIARQDVDMHAGKILALETEKEAMAAELRAMRAQLNELAKGRQESPVKAKGKSPGRPKKIKVEDGIITTGDETNE